MLRWLTPLLALLFFFSGVAALIYQVMWLRLLGLVFGVTVYAASTVLASFMAGLAIGSYSAGRLAGRLRSPLRAFGLVEIGVGLTALLTPLAFSGLKGVWIDVQPLLPSSLWIITVARFLAASAILIIPTTLMGATLPLVMRSALASDAAVGSRVGLLYAANTAGAVAGALLAGFYLVSDVGVGRSFYLAALINVVVGLVAVVASRRIVPVPPHTAPVKPHHADAPSEVLTAAQRTAVLWTFILSGALSLALELVWFRMLVTMLRPTAYAFTLMLAAVLFGIAAGSAVAAPLLRRGTRWLPALTVIQLAISIAAVLSLNALTLAGAFANAIGPTLIRAGLDPYLAPIVVASLVAMLPTTLLLGFAFPIGLSLWTGAVNGSERRIGVFYSLNVCGAIAGAVLGGFVLLPVLGSHGSLIAVSGLALIACLLLALPQWRTRPNFAGFMLIVAPIAFGMAAVNAADPFAVTMDAGRKDERLLWRQEGVQTTVAIHEQGSGGRAQRIMYLDGMHQASDFRTMTFVHHRIGALPVMLHPNPTEALVIGLGGGATAGAVARYPGVNVDVVELSSAVVGGASFFTHINFGLLDRPNVTLRVDDGRNYLMTTRKKYDVITADIILPRHAGAAALYSREYFSLVRDALKDDGLVMQWNGAEGDSTYRLILRTFMSVFPYTTLWGDGTLMIGSKTPFTFSRSAFDRRYADPKFRELFDWNYDTLAKTYVAGPDDIRAWLGEGPILSDDKPVIEYFLTAPKGEPAPDFTRLPQPQPTAIVRP